MGAMAESRTGLRSVGRHILVSEEGSVSNTYAVKEAIVQEPAIPPTTPPTDAHRLVKR